MVSIIIPVLNEAALIGSALEILLRQSGDYEVIVVDGGSADGTGDIVRQFPVTFVDHPPSSLPGLGFQINRGAEQARGDTLLFLHCDVELPPLGVRLIESAMQDAQMMGGGFMPSYCGSVPRSERWGLALAESVWQIRTRLFQWFAGDSAPFVRRDFFLQNGGYPRARFASDWDFAEQLRKSGRLRVIREPVRVQSRRLVQNGALKSFLVTCMIQIMYQFRANRNWLQDWYRKNLPRER